MAEGLEGQSIDDVGRGAWSGWLGWVESRRRARENHVAAQELIWPCVAWACSVPAM